MSPDLARKYVEDIKESAGNPEAAHSLEDESRDRFLHACSSGYYGDTSEARLVAKILMETDEIDFPRWCE